MRIPLAGGGKETLLSEVGDVLLSHLSMRDACALRLVCRECHAAVRRHPWEDRETVILGSIAAWRACFPRARCANVVRISFTGGEVRTAPVVDADFVHFEGLRELNMMYCDNVTDAAFVHLRGIHSLEMSGCTRLTDAALVHLVGIQRLGMFECTGITDAAFVHLRNIQLLNIMECTQLSQMLPLCTYAALRPSLCGTAVSQPLLMPPLRTCGAFARWRWMAAGKPPSLAPLFPHLQELRPCACTSAAGR